MSRRARTILALTGAVCGVAMVLFAVAVYTLQTDWFKQRVREKIVSAAQEATGGRVELGAFNYNWRTLSADFDRFVVHGSEPGGAAPLFQAPSIRVGLRIVSLLKRDVDIRFLELDRPEIHLIVHPDGTTNFPRATAARTASDFVDELFRLRVDRFEIKQGVVETEAQKFSVTLRGSDLNVRLAGERRAAQYEISIAARNVQADSERLRGLSGDLAARMRVERDRVLLDEFAVAGQGASIRASGSLEHFANPVADFKLQGQMDAIEAARLIGQPALKDGEVAWDGAAHYDARAGVNFAGKVSGRQLSYRLDGTELRNIDFNSGLVAGREEIRLTNLAGGAPAGRVNGDATVRPNGAVQFTGKFSGVHLRQIRAAWRDRLPWDGVAGGNLQLTGTLGKRDFAARVEARIAPSSNSAPVSGEVNLSYRQLGEALTFGESHLNLPHTQVAFSGTAGERLRVAIDNTDLSDLDPVFVARSLPLPVINKNGSVHFEGSISGSLSKAYVQGNISATQFQFRNLAWRELRSHIDAAEGGVDLTALTAEAGALRLAGSGHIGLEGWQLRPASTVRLQMKLQGADVASVTSGWLPAELRIFQGMAAGSLNLAGSLSDPHGAAHLRIDNLDAYGQRVNTVEMDATIAHNALRITQGKMQAGPASLSFSGGYEHSAESWGNGRLSLKADSNGFPLASVAAARHYEPGLQAQIEIHAQAAAKVTPEHVEPLEADGRMIVRGIVLNRVPYGSMEMGVATRGELMEARFSGDLRETRLAGSAQVQLAAGLPANGEVRLDRMDLATLYALLRPGEKREQGLGGFVKGGFKFSGPLEHWQQMRASVRLDEAEIRPGAAVSGDARISADDLVFRNYGPILVDAENGVASIRSLDIQGKDTALSVKGSFPYAAGGRLQLSVGGEADLRLFELLDPDMRSSGQSVMAASITGTLSNPAINGTLRIKNGAFAINGVSNGLSDVNGRLKFDRDRATLEDLTAQTGGGSVSLSGFVSYGVGGPLVYRLKGNAENVRMRYGGGGITSNADLQLTGTSRSSVLSGTVAVSRVALSANTDIGTLLASFAAPGPVNEQDFLTGLQLDLRVENAPNLQLSTALSRDVEADIDLQVRGTLTHPVLLGSISANQGDIKVFGTKYSINRAQVSFLNAAKIEPLLDLDLETRARGVIVDITIAGTPGKLNINYRSDPPLQPRDIIALLTVGRAPDAPENVPSTQSANDVGSLQPGANSVLGAAMSPNSGRLQKLFGVANIKIDPMVQGITNTMQRLTIEQQISRDITVTYVTNLSQTSEQIFRFEWALSQQYSLVALRDDNGEFGIDIQYKKRFK